MTEAESCSYFHPFTCGRLDQCPESCRRKAAFDEYHAPESGDQDFSLLELKENTEDLQ